MSEWRSFTIEDFGEIQNQKRVPLSAMQRAKRAGRYPYYGASGVVDYIDDFIFDGEYVLISEDGENLRTRNTPIAFKASGKFWVNNHAHILKCRESCLSNIIIYYFKNLDLNPFISGAVQPKLNKASLLSIPILLPESEVEQKSIASILSSLDDKIDLLHRQNKTLEAMAETLFRQWFVERDGDTCTISELIQFNPSRKLTKGSAAPYVEMSALSTTTFHPDAWYLREFSSGTKFTNGDTLLARITPCLENGKAAYVCFLKNDEVAWGSTEYIVMRPHNYLHSFFAYALARNRDFRDYAEGCLEGSSGRQRVNVDHLKNYQVVKPSNETTMLFNSFASSIIPKLHANSRQIKSLEKLRDTLLPKLMSGEVRVS
ncbi:MAG: restriction endonuclease subunit S [Cellvibrionaceae bacterium]|nr:restriction endonuclease subunit S [Cellvibrionaceae bacterium]